MNSSTVRILNLRTLICIADKENTAADGIAAHVAVVAAAGHKGAFAVADDDEVLLGMQQDGLGADQAA